MTDEYDEMEYAEYGSVEIMELVFAIQDAVEFTDELDDDVNNDPWDMDEWDEEERCYDDIGTITVKCAHWTAHYPYGIYLTALTEGGTVYDMFISSEKCSTSYDLFDRNGYPKYGFEDIIKAVVMEAVG